MGLVGLVKTLILCVLGVLALLAAIVGVAFAADAPVQATVTKTQCAPPSVFGSAKSAGDVTVKTKLFGILYTVGGMPAEQCNLVQANNFVTYHLRTKRTSLYVSEGGACIYDSVYGVAGCGRS